MGACDMGLTCVRLRGPDDTAQALVVVAEYLQAHPIARGTGTAPKGDAPDAFDPICSPLLLQVRRRSSL